MAKPFFRQNIPVNSTLTIKVSPVQGDGFTAKGRIEDPNLQTTNFNNTQLMAGTPPMSLSTRGVYVGDIDITFSKPATARLHIEVQKPDGSKHVYDEQATRPSNIDRTHIMLIVK